MEFNMIKNYIYPIPDSGKIYKGETGHPQKVRQEEIEFGECVAALHYHYSGVHWATD